MPAVCAMKRALLAAACAIPLLANAAAAAEPPPWQVTLTQLDKTGRALTDAVNVACPQSGCEQVLRADNGVRLRGVEVAPRDEGSSLPEEADVVVGGRDDCGRVASQQAQPLEGGSYVVIHVHRPPKPDNQELCQLRYTYTLRSLYMPRNAS